MHRSASGNTLSLFPSLRPQTALEYRDAILFPGLSIHSNMVSSSIPGDSGPVVHKLVILFYIRVDGDR